MSINISLETSIKWNYRKMTGMKTRLKMYLAFFTFFPFLLLFLLAFTHSVFLFLTGDLYHTFFPLLLSLNSLTFFLFLFIFFCVLQWNEKHLQFSDWFSCKPVAPGYLNFAWATWFWLLTGLLTIVGHQKLHSCYLIYAMVARPG